MDAPLILHIGNYRRFTQISLLRLDDKDFHLHSQDVVLAMKINGQKIGFGPMRAILCAQTESEESTCDMMVKPCTQKRGLDPHLPHLDRDTHMLQRTPKSLKNKVHKSWLYTTFALVPGGSGSQVCCHCGTVVSSRNVNVRKKVCVCT